MMVERRKALYILLGILPWAVWAGMIIVLKALVRTSRDPSLYTGTCYKLNGLAVQCSLDQWLLWDATPALDIFTFIGAIVAAALSGYVFIRSKRIGLRNP
uniref:Uncharacterized protein n=1 Tax=Cyanothece sp. (strain PCC 7425 / ATCC 29141) TaxID=395961 RepID=B8HZI9_CYAP4